MNSAQHRDIVVIAASASGVGGALTLIRRDDRRGFPLADAALFSKIAALFSEIAALFSEIAAHLAITLSNRGMLDGPA